MSVVVAKHGSPRTLRSFAPLILIGGVLLGAAGFAWSQHLSDSGEVVAARVSLHGIDMGGMSPAEVESVVNNHARRILDQTVDITFPGGTETFALADLGFEYDESGTVDNVLDARRNGSAIVQLAAWAATPLFGTSAEVDWWHRPHLARAVLANTTGLTPISPIEPGLETDGRGNLVVHPGQPGSTVDIEDLIEQLARLDPLDPPQHIEARLVPMAPTVADNQLDEVAGELTELTSTGVLTSVGNTTIRLSPQQLRTSVDVTASEGAIDVSFDLATLQAGIEGLYSKPIAEMVRPVFEIVEGRPIPVTPGTPPQVCCSTDTAAMIADIVLEGVAHPFVAVPLRSRSVDDAETLDITSGALIVEQVSSFTTSHACCENRVKNIQRMADIVDGYYLLPGETLSLNDYIGPRTTGNGFLAAGAIRYGHLTEEVGGGVSQFATTMFNAAYFAGLDFVEYRSHSLYFSRYPYGREATISSPAPDLAIENTTAYPILIDTSYTETSITVSMYSTANVAVDELEQRVTRRGACTHVETDRERSYADGRIVVDTIVADYRPTEGIDCSGNPILPPVT